MRTYHGITTGEGGPQTVYVSDENGTQTLDPRPSQQLRNHSPDGFQWGYGGSGPAQLALAILLDHFGDAVRAQQHYQQFKWETVARFSNEWKLTSKDIDQIIGQLEHKKDLSWTEARFNPWP